MNSRNVVFPTKKLWQHKQNTFFFSHQESSVGVAIVDMDTKKFYMGEIPDDDYYSNLEAFIVQKSPKECLVPAEYLTENKNKIVAVSNS